MLIRLGDVIYWIGTVCAILWLGAGIWVYYINPAPPSEATFVLLMFIGSAILIYGGGWCVRYVISGKKTLLDDKRRAPRNAKGKTRTPLLFSIPLMIPRSASIVLASIRLNRVLVLRISARRKPGESLEDRLKPRAAMEHTYAVVTRITRRELSQAFQKLGLKPKSKLAPCVW